MVTKELNDWIIAAKDKGYSRERLELILLERNYTSTDISEALDGVYGKPANAAPKTVEQAAEYGKLFTVLFNITIILFFVPLSISFVSSIISFNIFSILYCLIWGGVVSILLVKGKKYAALLIMLLIAPLYLGMLTGIVFIQAFTGASDILIYILIGLYSALCGLFAAFMFNKLSRSSKSYVWSGVSLSLSLAMVFTGILVLGFMLSIAASAMSSMNMVMGGTGDTLGSVSEGFMGSSILGIPAFLHTDIISPTAGFIIAFICFNIFYVLFFFKRDDRKNSLLFLYLIPAIFFVILNFIVVNALKIMLMAFAAAF